VSELLIIKIFCAIIYLLIMLITYWLLDEKSYNKDSNFTWRESACGAALWPLVLIVIFLKGIGVFKKLWGNSPN